MTWPFSIVDLRYSYSYPGLLLQEHVAQTMGLSTSTSAPDKAPKVEETDWEDDMDEVEEAAVDDTGWPQPEQTDQLS